MNVIGALLITFIIYPVFGTLLFALMEQLSTTVKMKVAIMTFGHPLLAGIIIWLICSAFNEQMALTGVLLVTGFMIRGAFSDRKYLLAFEKDSESVIISYYTEILIKKTMRLTTAEITEITLPVKQRLIYKPSVLTVTKADKELKFIELSKIPEVSL